MCVMSSGFDGDMSLVREFPHWSGMVTGAEW